MTVSATKGAYGWVAQVAQDTLPAAGDYNTDGMRWHKVIQGDLAMNQMQEPYPFEVGGTLLPPGTYKGGYWSGGTLQMHPRLMFDDTLPSNGLLALLYTYAGTQTILDGTSSITTTTLATDITGTATIEVSGGFGTAAADQIAIFPGGDGGTVDFGFDQGDGDDRWLTVRKLIPSGASGFVGESFYNSKVNAINITAAAGAPLQWEVVFQGAAGDSDTYDQVVLEGFAGIPPASEGWDYSAAYDVTSIPISTYGSIKQGTMVSTDFKRAQNMTINLGSNMTPPPQMLVVGQFTPIDYSVLSRQIGVSYDFLWANADLYREIFYGSASGTTFDPDPYTSPFWTSFASPDGTRQFGFFATNVHWMAQPIGLRAPDLVRMRVDGIVAQPSSGAHWGVWMSASDIGSASGWPT